MQDVVRLGNVITFALKITFQPRFLTGYVNSRIAYSAFDVVQIAEPNDECGVVQPDRTQADNETFGVKRVMHGQFVPNNRLLEPRQPLMNGQPRVLIEIATSGSEPYHNLLPVEEDNCSDASDPRSDFLDLLNQSDA